MTTPQPSADKKPRRATTADWEAVERDYRIGQLTIRQIAEKHNCSTSAITNRAKKDPANIWTRDLTEAVRVATKTKVRAKVVAQVKEDAKAQAAKRQETATQETTKIQEAALVSDVEIAATVAANIILGSQKRTVRLSALLEQMTGELEMIADEPKTLSEIADMIKDDEPAAAEAISRLRSITSRMNNLKTASEVLVRVNGEERKAFSIDEDGKQEKTTIEEVVAKIIAEDER